MHESIVILLTLGGILAVGYPVRDILARLRVPSPVTLIALGVVIGPACLDLLPLQWTDLATTFSYGAFAILLLRAGFGLPVSALRRILPGALLLGTLPVAGELACVAGLTGYLVFNDWNLAILCGFLIAAVSPAVILPAMLDQKDAGRGATRLIPDLIVGQTVVNALLAQTGILLMVQIIAENPAGPRAGASLIAFPIALVGGVALGALAGWLIPVGRIMGSTGEKRGSARRTLFVALVMLGVAIAVYFGAANVGIESVFATLALGVLFRSRLGDVEAAFRPHFKTAWRIAEVVLFVNLGAAIGIDHLSDISLLGKLLAVLLAAVILRLVIARLITGQMRLSSGEKKYITVAHVPKATIQAVFGAFPLMVFQQHRPDLIESGQALLVMAVIAIIVTAPVGAFLIDRLADSCLDNPRA